MMLAAVVQVPEEAKEAPVPAPDPKPIPEDEPKPKPTIEDAKRKLGEIKARRDALVNECEDFISSPEVRRLTQMQLERDRFQLAMLFGAMIEDQESKVRELKSTYDAFVTTINMERGIPFLTSNEIKVRRNSPQNGSKLLPEEREDLIQGLVALAKELKQTRKIPYETRDCNTDELIAMLNVEFGFCIPTSARLVQKRIKRSAQRHLLTDNLVTFLKIPEADAKILAENLIL